MARAPILQVSDIALTFGGDPIFSDLSVVVQPGDRVALVGRNGSGKSTLMKVMAGLVEADTGAVVAAPGVSVGYMEQDPTMEGYATLGEYAASGLDVSEAWRVDAVAEGLKFDPDRDVTVASGGERRRAALAAFILISHDRAFLNALTRATLWVDRGQVSRQDKGFEHFEAWREKAWEEEDLQRHKLNRKIKAEARWAVEGISARRKRNMGRVRALQDLRAERAGQIKRQGTAAMAFEGGQSSGKKVIEAVGLKKAFEDKTIVRGFDITVQRGDRVAFVGPNGVGKTTLIKMLLGETAPDEGTVKHGTNLEIAVFDQARAQLNPDTTLWDNLTTDPSMAVSGKADQIMVRGQPKHVVGYLKEFLFDERQVRAPVRSLSGGEKARLLLARLMARESNVLILDEPTNDLDIETLDLLQDLLGDYPGTVLLVSHDRDFIDRVATTTIAMEGQGRAVTYAGGWSDYQNQKAEEVVETPKETKAKPKAEKAKAQAKDSGLSFTEKHRLEALPAEIERLEAEIAKLGELMADPALFTDNPVKFQKATDALLERQEKLDAAEEEWMMLEEKAG